LTFAWRLVLVAPAHATFPGADGKITFDAAACVYSLNPDGSGEALASPM
jgi:hypothetical protein